MSFCRGHPILRSLIYIALISVGDQSKYTKEPKVNKDELKKQRPKHRKTRHGDGAGIKFAEGKEHVQRVVATGGLTKALNENAGRYGVTESIDMVFPVSWIKPLAVHGLTEDDLECIRKHTEDVSRGKKYLIILRACLYEAGWPVSELARQQASPVLYERFESEPPSTQPGY